MAIYEITRQLYVLHEQAKAVINSISSLVLENQTTIEDIDTQDIFSLNKKIYIYTNKSNMHFLMH